MTDGTSTTKLVTTRGEVALGGDDDEQPARRAVLACKNLETSEVWLEVRNEGELIERIDYDDWHVAQEDALRLLLGGGPVTRLRARTDV